ncbi:hypothetical protein KAR91_87940 [Candidatus Pacearchaeota archaeon]|nr:hypothetical protein [Candidatus Pacearchaeota archaeon]
MLMHMTDELKIVDANEKALERLLSIIEGESSTIGDVVWSNRDDEPSVIVMFFAHDRVRVGNIYILPYQHLHLLLQFMNRGPQSI